MLSPGGYEYNNHEGNESRACLMEKALIGAYCFDRSIRDPIPTFFLLIRYRLLASSINYTLILLHNYFCSTNTVLSDANGSRKNIESTTHVLSITLKTDITITERNSSLHSQFNSRMSRTNLTFATTFRGFSFLLYLPRS